MNRNLKLVSISLFTWGIGEGLFLFFQPIYLQKMGADPISIGAILGGMGLMTTLSQIPSGYLSDRFGSRPIMWISWILGTIAAGLMAFSGSLNLFIVALLLYGFTGSVLAPMNAYITSMRGEWSAERSLTFTSAAFHLGAVIGPSVGGFLGEQLDLRILYYFAAGIFVISTFFILLIENPVLEFHYEKQTQTNILKNSAFIRIAFLGFLTLFFMVFTQNFSSVFLSDYRMLSLQQIGFLGTIGSLGNVILALAFGNVSSKSGFLMSLPFVLLFPLFILFGNNFYYYGFAYLGFGGYRLARSMLLALSREYIHAKETGLAFGVIETANGVATIVAPILCGIVYNQNPEGIYVISIVGLVIIGFINLILLPQKRTKVI
jgi:MFS family permease